MGKKLGSVALGLGMLASSALGGCSFMGNQEESKDVTMKKFKLLMIGNSYSDDTAWLLPNIASNFAFEEMEIGVLYIGGCSLGQHYENSKTGAASYNFRYFQDGHWIET
jgi:hypothetical protein